MPYLINEKNKVFNISSIMIFELKQSIEVLCRGKSLTKSFSKGIITLHYKNGREPTTISGQVLIHNKHESIHSDQYVISFLKG